MPEQAQIMVGIPVTDWADIVGAANKFGVTLSPGRDLYIAEEDFDNAAPQITIEGKQHTVTLYRDEESGGALNNLTTNLNTSEKSDSYICIGVWLTQRYGAAIIDAGWPNGRPEPFVLDLERLEAIRKEVREQWPEAEILLQSVWY